MSAKRVSDSNIIAAAIYVGGAIIYWLAVEKIGLTFDATPALFGAVLLTAGVVRRRSLAPAILLLSWGAGVILVRHGPLPDDREAPVFIAAFGIGMAVIASLGRWLPVADALRSAAIVMLTGGLGFYLAYDYDALNEPWLWTLALIASGLGVAVLGGRGDGAASTEPVTREIPRV